MENIAGTFSGRSWGEVADALTKPFPSSAYQTMQNRNGSVKKKADGTPVTFLPRNVLDKRLRDAAGVGNFAYQPVALPDGMSHLQRMKMDGSEDEHLYVTMEARLDIFDDEGVIKVTSYGVASVICRDYNQDLGSAYSRACKRACLALLLADEDETQQTTQAITATTTQATTQAATQEAANEGLSTLHIKVTKEPTLERGAYRGTCESEGGSFSLILWEATAKKTVEKYRCSLDDLLGALKVGKEQKVLATLDEFRGQKQIVVRGFAK